jgi:hypothetical protein
MFNGFIKIGELVKLTDRHGKQYHAGRNGSLAYFVFPSRDRPGDLTLFIGPAVEGGQNILPGGGGDKPNAEPTLFDGAEPAPRRLLRDYMRDGHSLASGGDGNNGKPS